ncbi:hypothetical protein GALMADRAFT_1118997 [Galerina marginata CBS 339.88]|uniref:MYND-type domain-containing protein n=1 Tax=Galerina marginata (strain CBS 339.88) TaxID=685588 RepID=A0A067TCZ6_GALM3|nr:hypothetical protein GALMADRAFT_1118997 [Galerina marginata CBS 339.88]
MSHKDISREDTLVLLASMGIVLPKDTKLPIEELNKRLGQALDTSQEYSDHIETALVDPWAFPLWPTEKSLYEATKRGNMTESLMGSMSQPKKGDLSSKEDTFKEMRQSVLSLAYACDQKIFEIFFMGAEEKWGIFVRILDVYTLKNEVPLFYFVYKELLPSPNLPMKALKRQIQLSDGPYVTSIVSDLERRTLLRLFQKNGKRLDPKYHEPHKKKGIKDLGLSRSFVLPLCPIGMRNLGKLTADPGCDVCGKGTNSRCLQCLSVLYCSKECQRADWPSHKQACKSLKGGKWHTISMAQPTMLPFLTIMNRLDSSHAVTTPTDEPPPDVHNGKMFLAKFQVSLSSGSSGPGDMLVYDRQRSIRVVWKRSSDPVLFDEATRMIGSKLKFFRWLKRTGPYQFEICIDRAPDQDPLW